MAHGLQFFKRTMNYSGGNNMETRIQSINQKGREVKMMKGILCLLAAMVMSLGLFTSANATSVGGLIWPDGTATLLSDNSADFIIDGDGDPTTVGVGDILVTIVGINTIEGTSNQTIGAGTTYNELTAITAVKISSMDGTFTNPQGLTMAQYYAQPLTGADTAYFDWATGTVYGGLTFTSQTGLTNDGIQFGLLYEDSANNYTRDGSVQTGLTYATDGTYRLTLGLDAAAGDYLTVFAPVNLVQLAAFAAGNPSTAIDLSNISLNGSIIGQNWGSLSFFTDFTGGNGGFSTPTPSSSWPIFDNLDFTVRAVQIPEPGSFLLMGLGLLAAGLFSRKRRN